MEWLFWGFLHEKLWNWMFCSWPYCNKLETVIYAKIYIQIFISLTKPIITIQANY